MYVYDDLRRDCCRLCRKGAVCGTIGRSLFGAHIVCFHLGPKDGAQMIVQGGMHAREWVTSLLVVRQAETLLREKLPIGIFFIPMTNPDGAELAQRGCERFPNAAELLRMNGSRDFRLWKANGRGVDINCNFDARWGRGKGNVPYPAPASCVGARPESEPETAALASFTRRLRPVITVSYHALGREIYYEFGQRGAALGRDRALAEAAGKFLGYRVVSGDLGSAGGYKDWCVSRLGITALTVEIIGEDKRHPLREEDLAGEEKNIMLPLLLAELVRGADGG
ncbi:MAG TPA: hypothetical protein H9892_06835 [Candidatus Protoclostridium stercorigallinarum]|uniref:Peptidase M14 domain-containing protein n=1 Tax=Candidatus Protoclostridium stercorigallinarum TaxID=2838741 RepID=A0A9D1Q186_9FIRM|nr:hypothetical protein [Candidatus Protoclostridium stercorigallinarum]